MHVNFGGWGGGGYGPPGNFLNLEVLRSYFKLFYCVVTNVGRYTGILNAIPNAVWYSLRTYDMHKTETTNKVFCNFTDWVKGVDLVHCSCSSYVQLQLITHCKQAVCKALSST